MCSSPEESTIDEEGRPARQIELCDGHAEAMIARERRRGFEIFDHRISAEASLKPCRGRPFGLYRELESESQTGHPGLGARAPIESVSGRKLL